MPYKNLDKRRECRREWYKNNIEWWKKIKTGEYLEYYEKQYNK